ncbi:MAG: serine hydrolase domain-containing protein, partial [Pseudomonadota bacterium]|nr:serine hydrolase domain-containing protein [Pseudomonadota bacterium]
MTQLEQQISDLVVGLVEADSLPGIVCGVADRAGTRLQVAAGVQNSQTRQSMTNDSIIAIASMTKPITTMAALQLFEQGLIGLDNPVSDYL